MARKPRLDSKGCLHHVMARGNGGQKVFLDDEDRRQFYSLLGDGVERFGHTLHAFCLMDNHFHLLVRTGDVGLPRIMQNLLFRYTRRFNRRHGRTGHLFQGRYRSLLADSDTYLLELVRYVHLNPVRARLATDPCAWRWSGHSAYLGKDAPSFLDTDWVLGQFGGTIAQARKKYEKFVLSGLSEGYRPDFHAGEEDARIIGDKPFVKGLLGQKGQGVPPLVDEVIRAVCQAWEMDESELTRPGRERRAAEARAAVGFIVQDTHSAALTELAIRFGRDLATISSGVTRLRRIAKEEKDLLMRVESVKKKLERGRE